MTVTPPDTSVEYFFYPVFFDTLYVRPAPFRPSRPVRKQKVPVELLVKGALPDACSELSDVEQQRAGHIINVAIKIRRPKGAVCASVERLFRFYFLLKGRYGPGNYTVKINDQVYAFSIDPPDD